MPQSALPYRCRYSELCNRSVGVCLVISGGNRQRACRPSLGAAVRVCAQRPVASTSRGPREAPHRRRQQGEGWVRRAAGPPDDPAPNDEVVSAEVVRYPTLCPISTRWRADWARTRALGGLATVRVRCVKSLERSLQPPKPLMTWIQIREPGKATVCAKSVLSSARSAVLRASSAQNSPWTPRGVVGATGKERS